MMKARVQIGFSAVSLFALLVYTLVHTGGLLSRYVEPTAVGYVAAFGIEASVVGLSLRIGDLRRTKQSIGFFMFVLVAVVVVSAVANIAEGFTAVQGELLTVGSIRQLDPIQAFIGMAATGLISVIVLALSEIIGTDVETAVRQAERERRKQVSHSEENGRFPAPVEAAREARTLRKEEAKESLLVYLAENPNATLSEAGQVIERSKTTVSTYLKELVEDGRLDRNGTGWEVLS
ncbi:MAG: winged helix-turn-helix domain-containing protein [Anaerolineales bacterium]|nr:winged helix-turn-helix domain-containing protein [Anaerolineales bacterium]